MNKNILITGATGHLGQLVIEGLIGKIPTTNIFALARDTSKAEYIVKKWINIRQGDYRDIDSLKKAMKWIDTIYLISSNDTTDRTLQHSNVIEAAKASQVHHIVYTSFDRVNETDSAVRFITQAHIDTEKLLKESGIHYTILHHGLYMDILPDFLGAVPETGVVFFPAGTTWTALTARTDLAEWAIKILTSSGHENKTYNFINSESYNFKEIADTFSSLLGKTIHYIDPTIEEFRKKLSENHVPEMYIDMSTAFATAIKNGDFSRTDSTLEKLIWRKPTSLKEYIKSAYSI